MPERNKMCDNGRTKYGHPSDTMPIKSKLSMTEAELQ